MATVTFKTYDDLNRNAQPYPAHLLPEGGSALALFAAGFHGWNDVIHMVRKNMVIDCVDVDEEKLWQMSEIYPQPMMYHVESAWEFALEAQEDGREWDVVSVDPFMGDCAEKVWKSIGLWSSIATKLVTITVDPKRPIWAPIGWVAYLFPRSTRASWMVLRRA